MLTKLTNKNELLVCSVNFQTNTMGMVSFSELFIFLQGKYEDRREHQRNLDLRNIWNELND